MTALTPASTLALIDGAVHDWETSEDAMRWTPEPVADDLAERMEAYIAQVFRTELTNWQRDVLAYHRAVRFAAPPRSSIWQRSP